MWIVCDSGSTKADWAIIKNDGSREIISTIGFNPFYQDSMFIANELRKEFVHKVEVKDVERVYYYGTGIHDKHRANIVKIGLQEIMPNAGITVEHDLLASARATCKDQPGIACIIGTGSNTCLYDGKRIIDNVNNLGFLAGDEGSGAYIGKKLIQSYFYRELPQDLAVSFEKKYPEGTTAIKDKIYGDNPNVYLASFTRFLSEHKDHFYVQKLLYFSFEELINRHVRKYAGHNEIPIHFVGSIAFYFEEILKICLIEKGMTLGVVIKKPIESLVDFHIKHNMLVE
jgi:glucosamine kinase